jgi:hypothetical protein
VELLGYSPELDGAQNGGGKQRPKLGFRVPVEESRGEEEEKRSGG